MLRRARAGRRAERIDIEGLVLDQCEPARELRRTHGGAGSHRIPHARVLHAHPERVYTREQLLDRVWGGNVYVEERTIDVHIRRLRKALEEFGCDRLIQTVRGAGYRFSARPL